MPGPERGMPRLEQVCAVLCLGFFRGADPLSLEVVELVWGVLLCFPVR